MRIAYFAAFLGCLKPSDGAPGLRSAPDDDTAHCELNPNFEFCPGFGYCTAARSFCVAGTGCVCRPGWEIQQGETYGRCQAPIDECTDTDFPCGNAFCVDLFPDAGQYKCVCEFGVNGISDMGFGPTTCETQSTLCAQNPDFCATNGFCTTDNGDSFYCACNAGFTGDGTTCAPSESIETGSSGGDLITGSSCAVLTCPSGAVCGTHGSSNQAFCVCPPETTANADGSCDDGTGTGTGTGTGSGPNCFTNPERCNANQFCGEHSDRGPVCFCRPGYFQVHPGGFCREQTKGCDSTGSGTTCSSAATCQDGSCVCSDGYVGNGLQCVDVNECDTSSPCASNQLCSNTQGGFTCIDLVIEEEASSAPSKAPTEPVTNAPPPPPSPPPPQTPAPPSPAPSPAPLTVTFMADANFIQTSIFIYETKDPSNILLQNDTIPVGTTVLVGDTSAITSGCYTMILFDSAGNGILGGSIKVHIGNTQVVSDVFPNNAAAIPFEFRSYRFGSGCACTAGETAYDVELATTDGKPDRTLFSETPVLIVDIVTGVSAELDIATGAELYILDFRICLVASSCHQLTLGVGGNVDPTKTSYVISKATTTPAIPISNGLGMISIGDGCCPVLGSSRETVALYESFATTTDGNSVVRQLNSREEIVSLSVTQVGGGFRCVEPATCLSYAYQVPTGATRNPDDFLINYDGVVQSSASGMDLDEVEFGSGCAGTLVITVPAGSAPTGPVRVEVYDLGAPIVDYLLLSETSTPGNAAALQYTLSPADGNCYSMVVASDSTIQYTLVYNGAPVVPIPGDATNDDFHSHAPDFANARFLRFGDCGCLEGQVQVDLTASAPTSEPWLLIASNECIIDDDGCFEYVARPGSASQPFYTSLSVNEKELIQTSSPSLEEDISEGFRLGGAGCGCPSGEAKLFFSFTQPSGMVDVTYKSSLFQEAFAESTISQDCIPVASCTAVFLANTQISGSFGTSGSDRFILSTYDGGVIASGDAFPTNPFIGVGQGCGVVSVTATSEVIVSIYETKRTDGRFDDLEFTDMFGDPSGPEETVEYPVDINKCWIVTVVDSAGTMNDPPIVTLNGGALTAIGSTADYAYFEVGNCECEANEVPLDFFWFSPPDTESCIDTIEHRITQAGSNNNANILMPKLSNFLYNYRYCVPTVNGVVDQCLNVRVFESDTTECLDSQPKHHFKVSLDDELKMIGVYDRERGGQVTDKCCADDQTMAIISYYIAPSSPAPNQLRRQYDVPSPGNDADNNNNSGAGVVRQFCVDTVPSAEDQCTIITFSEPNLNNNRIARFGATGFLYVNQDSSGQVIDYKGSDDDILGASDEIVIVLGPEGNCTETTSFPAGFDVNL